MSMHSIGMYAHLLLFHRSLCRCHLFGRQFHYFLRFLLNFDQRLSDLQDAAVLLDTSICDCRHLRQCGIVHSESQFDCCMCYARTTTSIWLKWTCHTNIFCCRRACSCFCRGACGLPNSTHVNHLEYKRKHPQQLHTRVIAQQQTPQTGMDSLHLLFQCL